MCLTHCQYTRTLPRRRHQGARATARRGVCRPSRARAALAGRIREYWSLAFRFASFFIPLRDPDAVADYIVVEASLPEDLPRRADRLNAGLRQMGVTVPGGAWALAALSDRLLQWPRLRSLVQLLRKLTPAADAYAIHQQLPDVTTIACTKKDLKTMDGCQESTFIGSLASRLLAAAGGC